MSESNVEGPECWRTRIDGRRWIRLNQGREAQLRHPRHLFSMLGVALMCGLCVLRSISSVAAPLYLFSLQPLPISSAPIEGMPQENGAIYLKRVLEIRWVFPPPFRELTHFSLQANNGLRVWFICGIDFMLVLSCSHSTFVISGRSYRLFICCRRHCSQSYGFAVASLAWLYLSTTFFWTLSLSGKLSHDCTHNDTLILILSRNVPTCHHMLHPTNHIS